MKIKRKEFYDMLVLVRNLEHMHDRIFRIYEKREFEEGASVLLNNIERQIISLKLGKEPLNHLKKVMRFLENGKYTEAWLESGLLIRQTEEAIADKLGVEG